ncbi:MAG: phosphate acyltransferase PlsX [Hyphomicrobiales bacterium]|nr:phosphate acyltransferase PlsX [Hyphomicrobiales bacterium]
MSSNAKTITIALDVMGGDEGPSVVLAGAEISRRRYPEIRFVLHGEPDAVLPELDKYPTLKEQSVFHPCEMSIAMDDKPSQALRHGRRVSGMWKALESVKSGEADVMVSAGNTGALMAMSRFCLRMMEGIERPALAAVWPNLQGESIVLDVGATIGADAEALVDYALMGAAMSRALFDLKRPKVGLLNIGVEEVKGLEEIRTAGARLREIDLPGLDYRGFVEGDDLGRGGVDVVVTEGFTGNIALKSAEGTAKQVGSYLRDAMSRTWLARLGYLLAKQAFNHLREKMDPRKVNGAVFLGLNGIVIKSHGGTDAEGFASAIDVGHNMIRNELQAKIAHDLEQTRFGDVGSIGDE